MLGIDPGVTYTSGIMLGRLCGHHASLAVLPGIVRTHWRSRESSNRPRGHEGRYQLGGTKPFARSGNFTKIQESSASFSLQQSCTCVPEVDLATPATASECVRCAGEARWPQRPPSMTPNVCVHSQHSEASQMSEISICKKKNNIWPKHFLD